MPFGVAPAPAPTYGFAAVPSPAPGPGSAAVGMGNFLQVRVGGVNLGDRRVAVLDFIGSTEAPAPAPPPGPATDFVSIAAGDVTWFPGVVAFTEYSIGTANPTYTAAQYGGGGGAPDLGFGSFFVGQYLGAPPPAPPGVALGGWINGTVENPLALDLDNGPGTFIGTDGTHPDTPVLSGSPFLNGSIAMLFETDQAVIGITAGFFNAVGSTRITAYKRDGSVLGFVANAGTGIETFIVGTDTGTAEIAGLLFHFVAAEAAGFTIDSVRFGERNAAAAPAVLQVTRGWGDKAHIVTIRRVVP